MKKLFCTRCKIKPRAKKGGKCRSCLQEISPQYWSKKAWDVFSQYVRRRGAGGGGVNNCYTCHRQFKWQELSAGHFKHRGNRAYRAIDFEIRHIMPQCQTCNLFSVDVGEQDEFGRHLRSDYGEGWTNEIKKRWREEPSLTVEELKKIYFKYSELLKTI